METCRVTVVPSPFGDEAPKFTGATSGGEWVCSSPSKSTPVGDNPSPSDELINYSDTILWEVPEEVSEGHDGMTPVALYDCHPTNCTVNWAP